MEQFPYDGHGNGRFAGAGKASEPQHPAAVPIANGAILACHLVRGRRDIAGNSHQGLRSLG